jgi:hypothetical protein
MSTRTKKRPRGNQGPRPWRPMQPATVRTPPETLAAAQADPAVAAVVAEVTEIWCNDRYVVIVQRFEDSGDVMSLSIRRDDRKAAHDWRDFQRIKNEIAGPEVEAFELYPAQSRVVDTANQYWIWCMPKGTALPVGFPEGVISSEDDPRFPAARQRPLAPEET